MNSKLQAADLTQRLFSFVKILSRVTNTCLQMEFSRAHGQFCLWSSKAEACQGQSKVGWAPQGLRFHASGKGLAGVLKRPDYVKGFDELMRTERGDIFGFLLGNRSSSKACKVFMEKMPPHPPREGYWFVSSTVMALHRITHMLSLRRSCNQCQESFGRGPGSEVVFEGRGIKRDQHSRALSPSTSHSSAKSHLHYTVQAIL